MVDGRRFGVATFNKTITDPKLAHDPRSVRVRLDPLP
jgi:hypothetical protein